MLKFLRNKSVKKKIYLILAVAIIPPFAIWGVSFSQKGGDTSASLGTIGQKKVSIKDYLASYKAIDHQMLLFFGQDARKATSSMNLKGEAWDRLLLLNHAKQQGVGASDQDIVDWVAKQPVFQSKGQFDSRIYKLYMNNLLHANPRSFEEEIRGLITIQKVVDKLKSGIEIKDEELKNLYNQRNAKKDLAYGVLGWESQQENIEVSEQDIQTIYPIVKDKLTEPEKVKIAYLLVPKDVKDKNQLLMDAKDKSLDELSKTLSLPIKETRLFSKNEAVPDIGLSSEILFASFSLGINQESDWFHLDQGSYKIKVLDKKEERALSLEESKEELKRIIKKQKAIEAGLAKLKDLKTKMSGADLEAALKEINIETKKADQYSKGDYLPEIGMSDSIEKTISGLKENEISEPFTTPNGAAILKVTKISGADETKFVEDKTEFKESMIQEMTSEELKKLLEKLRQTLKINLDLMKSIMPEEAN